MHNNNYLFVYFNYIKPCMACHFRMKNCISQKKNHYWVLTNVNSKIKYSRSVKFPNIYTDGCESSLIIVNRLWIAWLSSKCPWKTKLLLIFRFSVHAIQKFKEFFFSFELAYLASSYILVICHIDILLSYFFFRYQMDGILLYKICFKIWRHEFAVKSHSITDKYYMAILEKLSFYKKIHNFFAYFSINYYLNLQSLLNTVNRDFDFALNSSTSSKIAQQKNWVISKNKNNGFLYKNLF